MQALLPLLRRARQLFTTTATPPPPRPGDSTTMDKDEASGFLTSLLNKNLRVTTADGRMFWGQFKCTDPDRNIVLSHTYEYRQPSPQQRAKEAEKAGASETVTMDLISRYLGLVVVPGQHIDKIELEEFASQMKKV